VEPTALSQSLVGFGGASPKEEGEGHESSEETKRGERFGYRGMRNMEGKGKREGWERQGLLRRGEETNCLRLELQCGGGNFP